MPNTTPRATDTHHNVPGDCWYCHGGCSVCTPDDECDTCECTGRITVTAWDDHGPYDAGAPCPDCR